MIQFWDSSQLLIRGLHCLFFILCAWGERHCKFDPALHYRLQFVSWRSHFQRAYLSALLHHAGRWIWLSPRPDIIWKVCQRDYFYFPYSCTRRMMTKIGSGITHINSARAFSVSFSVATTVLLCSSFGISVSTTHITVRSWFLLVRATHS